jgi:hypothetical protein
MWSTSDPPHGSGLYNLAHLAEVPFVDGTHELGERGMPMNSSRRSRPKNREGVITLGDVSSGEVRGYLLTGGQLERDRLSELDAPDHFGAHLDEAAITFPARWRNSSLETAWAT